MSIDATLNRRERGAVINVPVLSGSPFCFELEVDREIST